MTIARYDVNSANVNREVTFRVEGTNGTEDGGATLDNRAADIFFAAQGEANQYPFYGRVTDLTLAQELAQLRLNLVVRAMSVYTVPVAIRVVADSTGTNDAGAILVTYEADEFGAYFNQLGFTAGVSWPLDTSLPKHHTGDITDILGTGGMPFGPKTKDGLNTLVQNLGGVSFDGGTSSPFGALSTGDITLPDGRVVPDADAPDLDDGASTVFLSGLAVTFERVG